MSGNRIWGATIGLGGVICCLFLTAAQAQTSDYSALTDVFENFQKWKENNDKGLDFQPETMDARLTGINALQAELEAIEPAAWTPAQKSDYLTVRAQLDEQEFILRVTRPWSRDPAFYVSKLLVPAFTELPVEGAELEALQTHMRQTPAFLEQAKANLTEGAADYADLAISYLTESDGVEQGYPARDPIPAGLIGWYEDILARAKTQQPELVPDIEAALTSIRDFHDWLVEKRPEMDAPNGVGEEALNWFVQNALLMPYTAEEMLVLSERELDRLWAFYALERHRNRGLPEITLPESAAEYQQRIAKTDEKVRRWLMEEDFITIPDFIPEDWREMGYNVPWIERATPPNFWEQVQYRNPAPDHLHAVIPGHRFDARVAAELENPIRREANFGARWQGWAVYLEEGPLQAGFFEDDPRTRELIYIFGIWRAARSVGDIRHQLNEFNSEESVDYWISQTPLLDRNVARKYAYLRPSPGHGLEYTIGNIQMFRLLADRKRQLGEDFVLEDFHDDFISRGRIPMALIRYEMTGYEGDVETFWNRTPLEDILD